MELEIDAALAHLNHPENGYVTWTCKECSSRAWALYARGELIETGCDCDYAL